MCSHYTAIKKQEQLEKYFRARGIPLPPKSDMWPRYAGPFVRRPPEHDAGDEAVPEREAIVGRWGLISAMTKADWLEKAGKEKRMVVILPEGAYADWLTAPVADTRDFLQPYPADRLVAEPQ